MGFILKLQHGSSEIDLNADPYFVAPVWAPPAAIIDPLFSSGNMGNTFSGGELIEKRYLDNATTVPLNIRGTTAAKTHGATRRLISFIERALSDKSQTLYLVYNPSDAIPYAPKWGQSHLYWEIKDASAALRRLNDYLTTDVRDKVVFSNLSFVLAPLPVGISQTVGMAKGGVMEHDWATPDKISRGLVISNGFTNLYTNPIFDNATSYDTNYSVGSANLIYSEVTDKEFVFAGDSSVELYNTDASARVFGETLTPAAATGYTIAWYAKRRDRAAITSSICLAAVLGGTAVPTYVPIGDDWYWCYYTFTGNGVASRTGVSVQPGKNVIVDGFQLHVGSQPHPVIHGDMYGASWAGTAHESTSTMAAGQLIYNFLDMFDSVHTGALQFVVHFPRAYNSYLADMYLCDTEDSNFRLLWDQSAAEFVFADGTTTLTVSSGNFSAGATFVVQVSWGAGSMTLNVNGASDTDTFTPPASTPDYLYVGSTGAPGNRFYGILAGLRTWGRSLTNAQMNAAYTDVYALATGGDGYGQAVGTLPWHWTSDGDNTYDNCYESGNYKNFGIVGGIPGDVDAITRAIFSSAASTVDGYGTGTIWVNQVRADKWLDPAGWCFKDFNFSGSGDYCGGQYKSVSVTTDWTTISGATSIEEVYADFVKHMPIRGMLLRGVDSAGAIDCRIRIQYQLDSIILYGEDKPAAFTNTVARLFPTGQISIPDFSTFPSVPALRYMYFNPQVKRATGTVSMYFDFYHLAFDRLMKIDQRVERSYATTETYYDSAKNNAADYYSVDNVVSGFPEITGDIIELTPGKLNLMFIYLLFDNYRHIVDTPGVPTTTVTLAVTPRYTLL